MRWSKLSFRGTEALEFFTYVCPFSSGGAACEPEFPGGLSFVIFFEKGSATRKG
jgi:hypothetical protein